MEEYPEGLEDEISLECMKCNMYTEEGIFCTKCKRWYIYQCMPDPRQKAEEMGHYICSMHEVMEAEDDTAESENDKQSDDPDNTNDINDKSMEDKVASTEQKLEALKNEKKRVQHEIKVLQQNPKTDTKTAEKDQIVIDKLKKNVAESKKNTKEMEKQIKKITKENDRHVERITELEKIQEEARDVIDEKISMMKEIEGELREKVDENNRAKIKNEFYQEYWRSTESEKGNVTEPAENEDRNLEDPMPIQNYVQEIVKLEETLEKNKNKASRS